MVLDGIHVIVKGKYIGPEKPGPWSGIVYKLNIDVFNLGPLFVVLGILWLVFLTGFWTHQSWSFIVGIIVSTLTLWYLPIGTLISLSVLILLMTFRSKLNL